MWNKNRPAPAQPAKSFTDEELKQQYGIHMATRLQSDENGKDPKWADIDDEDEDWVPEAVTWIDGTKSSLTPADATPVPGPAEPEAPKPAEPQKPDLSALKRPVPTGPPKTILKPGAAAQAKQNGAAAASPGMEKPTLKAKSPAPAPVKSPWAALPPVDRVSPINPPVQAPTHHQPIPFASQDARAYDNSMPPPPMAREIAADTFDRAWREGEGERRELFNSNSGRYEPAPERRSSMRQDPYGRKPALLTRAPQAIGGPAEPSPAFQTRSGSNTDGPPSWGRRRGSSVSHGSMPADRRMSMQKAPEVFAPEERRQSTVVGHDMRASNAMRTEPGQPMFAQQSAWDQQLPPQPAPGQEAQHQDMEDPVAKQQRLMKEKRELAMKRKQEEEAAEESARKERIAAKLAGLSGAGKSRTERQAEQAAAAEAAKAGSKSEQTTAAPNKAAEIAAASGPALESQVAPPPQTGAQDAAKAKLPSPENLDLPTPIPKPQDSGLSSRSVSDQAQKLDARSQLSPNAHTPFSQAGPSPYRAPQSSYSSPGERKQQPFARDPFASPWPSAGTSNVWGASGIGNGTFEGASSFAPIQSSTLPPPPGMGRPSTTNRISPQGLGQDSRSPSMQASQPQEQRPFMSPGLDSRQDGFLPPPRPNGVSPGPGMGRQQHVPGPIAPPSRAQQQQNQPQQEKISAWRTATQTLPQEYANAGMVAVNKEVPQHRDDTFKETFRQTSGAQGRLGGPRKLEKAAYTVHDAQGSRSVESHAPAAPNTQTQPAAPPPTASPINAVKQAGVNTVRLPDVSANPAQGGMPPRQPPIGPPHLRKSQAPAGAAKVNFPPKPLEPIVNSKEQSPPEKSPPPPETSSHPVYSGDAKHPHVRLPQAKPKVKLPPTGPPQQQPVLMPQRQQAWGPPGANRPLVQSAQWQERFNGLFQAHRTQISTETPPSPPKTPPKMQNSALAVTSSTRMAMDDVPRAAGATVSLPQNQAKRLKTLEGFTIDLSSDVTSKPSIEPMFSEELTFASKPIIRVPNHRYTQLNFIPKHNMLAMGTNSRFNKPVDATSYSGFDMLSMHPRNTRGVYVKLLGVRTKHNPIFWRKTQPPSQQSKVQGKFNKGKGPAGPATAATQSGANSPVSATPNGTPAAGSRKASYQKAPTPANVPSPAPTQSQNTPAAATANAPRSPAPAGGKRGGFKGHRGGRGGAPVKAA